MDVLDKSFTCNIRVQGRETREVVGLPSLSFQEHTPTMFPLTVMTPLRLLVGVALSTAAEGKRKELRSYSVLYHMTYIICMYAVQAGKEKVTAVHFLALLGLSHFQGT